MRLRIVALGHRMPEWVILGVAEYTKRLPRDHSLDVVELRPEPRDRGKTVAQLLAVEAQRIAVVTRGCETVALDERGDAWSTRDLADALRGWRDRAQPVAFVIGSADGLDPAFKSAASHRLSLSAMTLPHGLVRVLIAEQVYRALSLLAGHPYHRE
jgi:23S rRNA (pseudouridine1915-N3)-methyltransferase